VDLELGGWHIPRHSYFPPKYCNLFACDIARLHITAGKTITVIQPYAYWQGDPTGQTFLLRFSYYLPLPGTIPGGSVQSIMLRHAYYCTADHLYIHTKHQHLARCIKAHSFKPRVSLRHPKNSKEHFETRSRLAQVLLGSLRSRRLRGCHIVCPSEPGSRKAVLTVLWINGEHVRCLAGQDARQLRLGSQFRRTHVRVAEKALSAGVVGGGATEWCTSLKGTRC
jgi:hypothetical protein